MVMRKVELELPMNQTQKVRFERAMERLKSLSSMANSSVVVADSISVNHEDALLKGHGTSEVDGDLLATVCGIVQHVDKLVYTRTLRSKYKPETEDIVVGRVIEVRKKHWRVDLNCTRDGVLNLNYMDNPVAVQRRKTSIDEHNMRNVLVEDDVLCARLGKSNTDGSIELIITQSDKYGKLDKGQLLKVDPYLVKRTTNHFHYIESLGIDMIIGRNGFIWVGEHVQAQDPMILDDEIISLKTRQSILRIGNAIRVLSNLGFAVTLEVIMETFNLSNTENVDVHDMLGSEFHVLVTENEAERRIRRA